jgi:sucrose-6-phosphate hydrolase SacC (GH32 family)
VFYGGNGHYLVGQFDGRTFTPEGGPQLLHHGNAFYASQTFNDLPAEDGRRILIPWGTVALPDMPFNQMMGLPVALTLARDDGGHRLRVQPVRELESLRTNTVSAPARAFGAEATSPSELMGELLEINAELELGDATGIDWNIRGVPVSYDVARQEITVAGQRGPLKAEEGRIRLRMYVDRASLDVFGNDGRLYMPVGVLVPAENRSLQLRTRTGIARIRSMVVHQLKSAWE